MLFFGKRAVKEADKLAREAERIKDANTRKFHDAEDSAGTLHDLLKRNGITLRIYVATGGDKHHG